MDNRRILTDKILSQITNKIYNSRTWDKKQVLMVLFGSDKSLDEVVDLMIELAKDYQLLTIISPAAMGIISQNQIERIKLYSKIINESNQKEYYNRDLKEQMMIIGTLTKNSCSKLALGIADNIALSWVLKGVAEGADILCCSDGVIINNNNKRFKTVLEGNLRILREYGIKLTEAKNLRGMISKGEKNHNNFSKIDNSSGRGIYTERIIKDIAIGGQLTLKQGDIITPLAKDLIRERKITLKYQ